MRFFQTKFFQFESNFNFLNTPNATSKRRLCRYLKLMISFCFYYGELLRFIPYSKDEEKKSISNNCIPFCLSFFSSVALKTGKILITLWEIKSWIMSYHARWYCNKLSCTFLLFVLFFFPFIKCDKNANKNWIQEFNQITAKLKRKT